MQPFLILANQRSGSSVLRYALNEQKGVVCHGELLRAGAHAKVSYAASTAAGWRRLEARLTPDRSLRHYLERLWEPRGEVNAVGFKLMYDQLDPRVSRLLAERGELRFVHLVRRNVLKSLISYEVARSHGRFTLRPGEAFSFQPIHLDPERLLPQLRESAARVERHRAWIGARPRIEVSYEALLADPRQVVTELLDFIGVPGEASGELPLRKMTPDSLDEAITNADEVRELLAATEFAPLVQQRPSS